MINDKREAIIQRIKKLKLHAESAEKIGSLEEAKIFMSKVHELMVEYNLTVMEIDEADIDDNALKNFSYVESVSFKDGNYYAYRKELIKVLCNYNFCQVIISMRRKQFAVYGNGINVDNVIWQYWYLAIRLKALALEAYRDFRQEDRYKFLSDFLLGAVSGIREALREERSKNNSEQALVVYNNKMVERYLNELGVRFVLKPNRTRTNFGIGASLGFKAGKNLQINNRKLGK